MTLHPHVRQGRYGESFVRVLAHSAGVSVSKSELTIYGDEEDDLTIDFRLGRAGDVDSLLYDPMIALQVKCWKRPANNGTKETWSYPLQSKYFNRLAGPASRYTMPRFLVVVMIPDDPDSWSEVTPEHLLLKEAAYWVCLHDQALKLDLAEETKVRVSVPRANLLTPAALVHMLEYGERLQLEGRGLITP